MDTHDPNDPENAPLTEEEQESLRAQDHLMDLRRRARAEKQEQEQVESDE